MRNLQKQAGDTIIEVLIVIMVLGTVLGGAFVTINRSTTNIRQSQERVEATKVAEGQVESLKSFSGSVNAASLFNAASPFCMANSTVTPAFSQGGLLALDSDQLDKYVPSCIDANNNGRYHIAIEPNYSGSPNIFLVHVRWFKYNGPGNEEVTLAYKVYK